VEASETGRRIFWRHRWLLLVLVILPAVGVVVLKHEQPVTYAATAIVQGQGTTPDTTTQVSAIQSRVASVASDPAMVQAVLTAAKVDSDPSAFAKHDISVTPVSTSAIMDITVTDSDPAVALRVSNSLATAVVNQLNHLTAGTGAAVVSLPVDATQSSQHAAVYGALAGLLGLIVGLLFAALREVLRPTVAQPDAGARELGAVLFGTAEERGGQIVALGTDLPERLNLAAHRAGVRTVVLTGPGSPDRLSSLADRLRGQLAPEPADGLSLGGARTEAGSGNASRNGNGRRPAKAGNEHRPVGLATADWPAGVAAAQSPEPQRTVVTLNDIRLGAPPADAALVVVLPRFAPHSALDQAADLGVTADWPILGVIGISGKGWLAALIDRTATRIR
jgi:capsular polysaccharide biosynthesis protein